MGSRTAHLTEYLGVPKVPPYRRPGRAQGASSLIHREVEWSTVFVSQACSLLPAPPPAALPPARARAGRPLPTASPCTAASTSRPSRSSWPTSRSSTGIKVAVRSADEATLANQIIQEGSRSPADVFFAENPPALQALDERKLLATVAAADAGARFRARDSSPSGDWVGVSARAAVLAYNTTQRQGRRPADLAARPRHARVEGQGRDRPGRDRLPAADHRDRAPARQGRRAGLAEGHQAATPRSTTTTS